MRTTYKQYMNEVKETRETITELVKQTRNRYGDYAYAAGYLEAMLADALFMLPKARREEFRENMVRDTMKHGQDAMNWNMLKHDHLKGE